MQNVLYSILLKQLKPLSSEPDNFGIFPFQFDEVCCKFWDT